jgi:hypothetical protein
VPSMALVVSVLTGCFVVSAMAAGSTTFGKLHVVDIVLVWIYDVLGLIFLDVLKVMLFNFFEENTDVLPDESPVGSISDKPAKHHGGDLEHGQSMTGGSMKSGDGEDFSRQSVSANRMTDWAIQHSERLSSMDSSMRMSMASGRSGNMKSANMKQLEANKTVRESLSGSIAGRIASSNGAGELRPSFIGGSIRPNVPGNRSKF